MTCYEVYYIMGRLLFAQVRFIPRFGSPRFDSLTREKLGVKTRSNLELPADLPLTVVKILLVSKLCKVFCVFFTPIF